jgi:FdhE protein
MGGTPEFTPISEQPLIPELPPRPSYAQRIQRAHDLADRYSSAAEFLRFYGRVAFHQQHIFESLGKCEAIGETWPLHVELVLPLFSDFARALTEISPALLRDRACELASTNADEQTHLLMEFWNGGFAQDSLTTAATDRFIALAFLQPYAEWLAQSGNSVSSAAGQATCPTCGSEPTCAVLRDRGHGAGRSLVCSLCMHEWSFLRVVCPACGEERFESLPVFTSQEMPHVRVDACDTCHHYINTIDMTKDGFAVPVVDELVAVSLDLWAAENHYQKLTANIAGI